MSKKLAISRTSDWTFLRNVIYRLSKTSSTYHKCLHVQIDKLSGNFFWLKNCSIYFLQFSYDLTIGLRSLIKNHSDSTKFVSEKRVSPRLTHKGLIHRLGGLFKVILYCIRQKTSVPQPLVLWLYETHYVFAWQTTLIKLRQEKSILFTEDPRRY